jgi:chromosome segregation ATPase
MVFGWGKKKKEYQEVQVAPLEKEIPLSEIKKTIDGILVLRTKTLVTEVNSFRNQISPKLKELSEIAKELEKDNLNVDDIDIHLRILVVRGKKQVISIIQKEATIQLQEVKTYDDVLTFNEEFSQILKKIGDILGRQSRVIHIFAKKYASKLKNILSTLKSDKEEIQKLVNNHENFLQGISDISDELNEIDESKRIIGEKKNKISNFKNSIDDLINKIIQLTQEIDDLKSTKEYNSFLDIKKNISNLSIEEHDIKNEIESQFTKISRPLSKYSYVSSLEKHQKILMGKLLERPSQELTSENKSDIVTILNSVRKAVESGSISIKDSVKSLNQIDETFAMLEPFINKVSEFNKKKHSLESELDVFDLNKLKQKESELEKTTNDKKDLESKIHMYEMDIDETEKKIPTLIQDIEKIMRSVSSTRYTVVAD